MEESFAAGKIVYPEERRPIPIPIRTKPIEPPPAGLDAVRAAAAAFEGAEQRARDADARAAEAEHKAMRQQARADELESRMNELRSEKAELQIKLDALQTNYARAMAAVRTMTLAGQQLLDLKEPV